MIKKIIVLIQKIKISLRWKLLAGFLGTNLLLVIALTFALLTLLNITNNLKSSYQRTEIVKQIELTQSQMVATVLDFLWSNNSIRLREYTVASENLNDYLENFQPSPIQAENYQALKKQLTTFRQTLKELIDLEQAGRDNAATDLWRLTGSKQAINAQLLTRDLSAQEIRSSEVAYQETVKAAQNTAWNITIIAAIAVSLGILLAFLLTSAVTTPVRQLRSGLADLARGDLSQAVQIANGDELGELSHTYNNTVFALRDLVQQLSSQSFEVNDAINELTVQARTQVAGVAQQASTNTEATRTLQALNRTAEEIAMEALRVVAAVEDSLKQAREVSQLADKVANSHEIGRATVAQTIGDIYTLRTRFEAIENQQQTIIDQASVIQNVMRLLENTARETHLLALNAAIEAAGAGSYGKRFAVIAREVKQLAERVVRGNAEISASLLEMLHMFELSKNVIEQGVEKASRAAQDAGKSDRILVELADLGQQIKQTSRGIVEFVENAVELANNIHQATQEQNVANQQMFQTMLTIESVTIQSLDSIKQSESATQRLSASAQQLKISAATFNVGQNELSPV